MRRIYLFTVLAAAVLILPAGCSSRRPFTRTTLYRGGSDYPQVSTEEVKVFRKKPESVEFTEIGEVIVENARDWEDIEENMKAAAAENGGNAVYIHALTGHEWRGGRSRVNVHIGVGHHFGASRETGSLPRPRHYSYGVGVGFDSYDFDGYRFVTATGIIIRMHEP